MPEVYCTGLYHYINFFFAFFAFFFPPTATCVPPHAATAGSSFERPGSDSERPSRSLPQGRPVLTLLGVVFIPRWLPSSLLLSCSRPPLPRFFQHSLSFPLSKRFFSLPLKINHKYPERRLLVAESCGALAPYLPVRTHSSARNENSQMKWKLCRGKKSSLRLLFLSLQKEIRSSLVLSMLQQMLAEDKADMVREAVIQSLGIIMGYIDDPDKYAQVRLRRESLEVLVSEAAF